VVAIDIAPEKLGAYRVRGKLGEGGMATVYVGSGPDGSLRALKVIKSGYAQNREFCTMFLDEGKISSQLHHDNIVRIWSLGSEGGRLFMVMDLVRGHSLHALSWAARDRSVPFAPEIAAYIGVCMTAALEHAHDATDEQGRPLEIVHRDVNPSNVIISYDGDVKMIDFGLARAVNKSSQTAAGVLKGKIGYLSPEQVGGKPLDRRSDVFSLGITLWEISLGRRLFKGATKVESVQMIHRAEVPDPRTFEPNYPPALWHIVKRCLMKSRNDRYQSAGDVGRALREYLADARPGVDMKTELASLMRAVFSQERAKQDAWLEQAAREKGAPPLTTLRPPALTGGSFESLPPVPMSSRPGPPSSRPIPPPAKVPSFTPAPVNKAAPRTLSRTFWVFTFVALLMASAAAAILLAVRWLMR
jgi:serine/threonine-protein kinase